MLVLVAKSCPTLLGNPWTVTRQVPLSMGLPRQEYWSGLPFPPPGDLPGPRIKPCPLWLLHLQVDSLPLSHLGSPFYNISILFPNEKGNHECVKRLSVLS